MVCKTAKFCLLVAAMVLAIARPATALSPDQLLTFCLNNSEKCAFSVNHITGGWERHWNADRLQVTASTFKILTLIAYAEAVVDDKIKPKDPIPLNDWARYWIGYDLGALKKSWCGLGAPGSNVQIDNIVSVMIKNSDNAATDWLLKKLGEPALEGVVGRYIEGYHDFPKSISGIFLTWFGFPNNPDIGNRMINDYSGFEVAGYQRKIDEMFDNLQKPSFVDEVRVFYGGLVPPWDNLSSPCASLLSVSTMDIPMSMEGEIQLSDRFFMRSTTRTYNKLMTGLLTRDLLKESEMKIVEPHLEWWVLSYPSIQQKFSRYGGKGGGIIGAGRPPYQLINWTTYIKSRITGVQVAVTIFMRGLIPCFAVAHPPCDAVKGKDLISFAEAIVHDSDFAEKLFYNSLLNPGVSLPELIPRITEFKHKRKSGGDRLAVTVEVTNIGTVTANGRFEVKLFQFAGLQPPPRDQVPDGAVQISTFTMGPLRSNKTKKHTFTVRNLSNVTGKYVIVSIDHSKVVTESVESNNVAWQIIP